jgi:hypothetical protein
MYVCSLSIPEIKSIIIICPNSYSPVDIPCYLGNYIVYKCWDLRGLSRIGSVGKSVRGQGGMEACGHTGV